MPSVGKITVLVMVLAAVAVGAWTVWFQHQRSRAVLGFWGPAAARLISAAPDAEILRQTDVQTSAKPTDIRQAKGIQNIRHALIQPETFLWHTASNGGLPQWDYTLRFREGSQQANVLFSVSSEQVALEGKDGVVRLHPIAAKEIALFCEEQFSATP